MIRSLLLLVVSFALVGCGDQADEAWAGSGSGGETAPVEESSEDVSPAQRLLLLLLGGCSDENAVATGTAFAGNYRASSPDPMPGRQRDDDDDSGPDKAAHAETARAR